MAGFSSWHIFALNDSYGLHSAGTINTNPFSDRNRIVYNMCIGMFTAKSDRDPVRRLKITKTVGTYCIETDRADACPPETYHLYWSYNRRCDVGSQWRIPVLQPEIIALEMQFSVLCENIIISGFLEEKLASLNDVKFEKKKKFSIKSEVWSHG